MFVTSALVAPGKADGRPWDGPGRLPANVTQALRRGLGPARRALLTAMPDVAPMAALTAVAPDLVDAMTAAIAQPDVQIVVSLDGRVVGRTPVARNTLAPTWAGVPLDLAALSPGRFVEFRAVDVDVMVDDDIGVCTVTAPLAVDARGYLAADGYACAGQLWGIAVRVAEQGR